MGQVDDLIERGIERAQPDLDSLLDKIIETASADVDWSLMAFPLPDMIAAMTDEPLLAELLGMMEADAEGVALKDFTGVEPTDAIEWFRARKIVSPSVFKRLSDSAKQRAFSVAGLTNQFALQTAHEHLAQALEQGISQQAAVKSLRSAFEAGGLTTTPHHLNLVFRNNVIGAYQSGRFAQLKKHTKRRPFWRYLTVGDHRVRPEHRAMNGKVYPHDSVIWATWYPPNGHQCRCEVQALRQKDLDRQGLKPSEDLPEIKGKPVRPDKGWATNPAVGDASAAKATKLIDAAQRSGVLRAPKLATKGSAAYVNQGDVGGGSASVVDRLVGMTRAKAVKLAEQGRFSVEKYGTIGKAALEARVPIPSQYADSAHQLLTRVLADRQFKSVGASIQPRSWYVKGQVAGEHVVVSDGLSQGTDHLIKLVATDSAQIAELADAVLQAEAGHGAALRRAPAVADIVLRGKLGKVEGYREAVLNTRKAGKFQEARLTREPLDGFLSEKVLVTNARWEQL